MATSSLSIYRDLHGLPNLPIPLGLQAQRDAAGYWEDIQAHVLLLIAISNIAQWS